MTFAVCLATCTYCGHTWRPLIETDRNRGFLCEIKCPKCGGRKTGHVRIVAGFEPTEARARARAESWAVDDH
jgi:hypothetical protein